MSSSILPARKEALAEDLLGHTTRARELREQASVLGTSPEEVARLQGLAVIADAEAAACQRQIDQHQTTRAAIASDRAQVLRQDELPGDLAKDFALVSPS